MHSKQTVLDLKLIKEKAAVILEQPQHRHYTDHSIEHSERVKCIAADLIKLIKRPIKALSREERKILTAAVYLHDVGMQFKDAVDSEYLNKMLEQSQLNGMRENDDFRLSIIRRFHHELSKEMIIGSILHPDRYPSMGLHEKDIHYARIIAEIVRGHGVDDLSDIPEEMELRIECTNTKEKIRVDLLTALLRVADGLDADKRRIDLDVLENSDIPVESAVHWYCHYYIEKIEMRNGLIMVDYGIPDRSYEIPIKLFGTFPIWKNNRKLLRLLWEKYNMKTTVISDVSLRHGIRRMPDSVFKYMKSFVKEYYSVGQYLGETDEEDKPAFPFYSGILEKPVFRWACGYRNRKFRITIKDETGRMIHEWETSGKNHSLYPKRAPSLDADVIYRWNVYNCDDHEAFFDGGTFWLVKDARLSKLIKKRRRKKDVKSLLALGFLIITHGLYYDAYAFFKERYQKAKNKEDAFMAVHGMVQSLNLMEAGVVNLKQYDRRDKIIDLKNSIKKHLIDEFGEIDE